MTQLKTGGPAYVPAAHGGLSDARSTSSKGAVAPRKQVLNDRRSTR